MSERIGEVFLEKTKYQYLDPSDQQKGLPQPPLHVLLREGTPVALPSPSDLGLGTMSLLKAIETRRSLRAYVETSLSLEELSYLLWCTQGVKPIASEKVTFRNVPSAGARHALETVLLIHRVEGLTPGFYQYDAAVHGLIQWPPIENISERMKAACLDQPMVQTSAVTFAWVVDRVRMAWRYGERGIRYLHLDAGHVCQNLHLAAESIGAGICAIGAYDDDKMHALLDLDGSNHFVIYMAALGKR